MRNEGTEAAMFRAGRSGPARIAVRGGGAALVLLAFGPSARGGSSELKWCGDKLDNALLIRMLPIRLSKPLGRPMATTQELAQLSDH
jgi:hypothetical protein